MGLPLSSLQGSDFINSKFLDICEDAFFHLTSLDLQLEVHERSLGHKYRAGDMDNLFEILPFAERLTNLSLGFSNFCLPADEALSVLINKWPAVSHSVVAFELSTNVSQSSGQSNSATWRLPSRI